MSALNGVCHRVNTVVDCTGIGSGQYEFNGYYDILYRYPQGNYRSLSLYRIFFRDFCKIVHIMEPCSNR